MTTTLTNEDIDVLMKSLDALQGKAVSDGLLTTMLRMAFNKDHEEAKREAHEELEKAKREAESISETIILLKAKLIQMRDRSIVQEAGLFLRTGGA